MGPGRRLLARIMVVVVLAGLSVVTVAGPAHAGLTSRRCATILTGDKVRRLDVCSRGWYSADGNYTRGVVEMHTYKLLGGINDWVDSTSQSISLNSATVLRNGYWEKFYGQESGGNCRVNGPGGSVGCSVPNTYRVAFYSPQLSAPGVSRWENSANTVSWRDDRGLPHGPVNLGLISPAWSV